MRIRIPAAAVAIAALSLGMAACTQSEQNEAEVKVDAAADTAGDVAAQAGEVIESGAMKAAQATEEATANVTDHLERNQAEAAAEGRPGAVNPATDERVPAPAN